MSRQTKNKISFDKQNAASELQKTHENKDASEISSDSNWQKDIETHDYYYDDSHGYKVYNPDKDEEENDDN